MPLAIQTSHLTRAFGSRVAVDDLALAVPQGSIYGFLGPNGAGKTTTIRLLLGLLRPTRGEILIHGEPVDHQDDHWKHLFALPVRRSSIFAAKCVAVAALVFISYVVLEAGLLTLTAVVGVVGPAWPPQPGLWRLITVRVAESCLAAWLFLAIQLWVSLRWRSFTAGVTVGIIAVLVMLGLLARAGGRTTLTRLFPWALPVIAVGRIVESTPNRVTAAERGALGGLLVAAAMCAALARREW